MRKFSEEFKVQVIKETLEERSPSIIARKYHLNSNIIYRWMKEYKEGKWGM
ncbi:transposase [Aneurinibacillus tyrosinisolvens]|uniref:transposase n=1 Tax=Aneurinibacillus tyrosinisolvens TaxID=1443435 RepID=UPI0009E256E7|nr:transposase [Aneurinibacillus tyrosinisolvens]